MGWAAGIFAVALAGMIAGNVLNASEALFPPVIIVAVVSGVIAGGLALWKYTK